MQRTATFCDRCGVETVDDAAPVRVLTIDTPTIILEGGFTKPESRCLEICALCYPWLNAWLETP